MLINIIVHAQLEIKCTTMKQQRKNSSSKINTIHIKYINYKNKSNLKLLCNFLLPMLPVIKKPKTQDLIIPCMSYQPA